MCCSENNAEINAEGKLSHLLDFHNFFSKDIGPLEMPQQLTPSPTSMRTRILTPKPLGNVYQLGDWPVIPAIAGRDRGAPEQAG